MDDPTSLTKDASRELEGLTEFDLSELITEDDEPVDNIFSAKQQRLLVEPLYTSAQFPRPFLVDSNVGIYESPRARPIVPDMFLSLGVQVGEDWWATENRSYLLWEFGKPPEVVVEIVSNHKGNETGSKLADYAAMEVLYYVIFDPQRLLFDDIIRVYQLVAGDYLLRPDYRLAEVGLSLSLWPGAFENNRALWLRWSELEGGLIPTGAERAARADRRAEEASQQAEKERQRAEEASRQAEKERQRAEEAVRRAEALAARLAALGIDTEDSDEHQ